MTINRRDLVKLSALAAGTFLTQRSLNSAYAQDTLEQKILGCKEWSNGIPPLFCTAYIDPTLTSQKGQETLVAKYPMALVPQDARAQFIFWRNKVRNINPDIKLLAYQMVIEETTVPGPGHDNVRKVSNQNVWCTYPGGFIPTVTWDQRIYRIYDPRSKIWQKAFLDACEATLKSYPFDGLFLDNCTIYPRATLIPSVRSEMMAALNETLTELRRRLPNTLIIGNSSYHFKPLNGSLNENRPKDLAAEAAQRDLHTPVWNLHQMIYEGGMPEMDALQTAFEWSIQNRCFFGASIPDYQHAIWPPLFEKIVTTFKSAGPSSPLINVS